LLIALSQIQTAYAQILALEHSEEWFTIGLTRVYSVFAGDVDGDGVVEVVTGGWADDGTRYNGQLRIWTWDGATLTLEHSEEWFTIDDTCVYSVFAGDVDGDGVVEIVTGGEAYDGTRNNGQLRIWALPPPVGGTVTPVNRLQLLAPLIYFTSLGFIAAAVALKRYRPPFPFLKIPFSRLRAFFYKISRTKVETRDQLMHLRRETDP